MSKTISHPESREKLLLSALFLIRSRGYAATTVDDICRSAGLTKGGFFHHFDSKEALAVTAADYFSTMAESLFANAPYQDHADPLQRLLGYIDFRIGLLRGAVPEFTCLLGTLVQETYDSHPAIRSACDKYLKTHCNTLAKDITEARRLYAPNAPWTPLSLAQFMQAAIQGSFIFAKATGGPEAAVDTLRHLRRYIESQFNSRKSKGASS